MPHHLTRLGGHCGDSNVCVTKWRDDTTGDFYVQGYALTAAEASALPRIPDGEFVIRVPAEDAHLVGEPNRQVVST